MISGNGVWSKCRNRHQQLVQKPDQRRPTRRAPRPVSTGTQPGPQLVRARAGSQVTPHHTSAVAVTQGPHSVTEGHVSCRLAGKFICKGFWFIQNTTSTVTGVCKWETFEIAKHSFSGRHCPHSREHTPEGPCRAVVSPEGHAHLCPGGEHAHGPHPKGMVSCHGTAWDRTRGPCWEGTVSWWQGLLLEECLELGSRGSSAHGLCL